MCKFEKLKLASSIEKGNIGEDFLYRLLSLCGYADVGMPHGRRGNYDISVKQGKKNITFEVKVATRDTNKHFQFNAVRYDTEYSHLFCLGVSPNNLGYLIYPKVELLNEKLVSMAKGSNSAYKLTKKETELKSFHDFS